MQIGPYKLSSPLLLAPMAGISDKPFRHICRKFGAGLAVSEMISADASLWGRRKSLRRMDHDGEEAPVSVQIVGSDPMKMADAARANRDMGAQIIDINMGCPAKKVCKVAAGSALLEDKDRVREILSAVVNAVEIPVTLKMRTGPAPGNRNGVEIARIAEDCGVQALAVHGRTRACKFAGTAEYETILRIKQAVSLPVVANGDIHTPEKAKQVLEFTGADGLMIGRAATGRPWIFKEIGHYLATGQKMAEPNLEWVEELLHLHLHELYAFYGETHGVRIARKHIAWYIKGLDGAAQFRETINGVDSAKLQLAAMGDFFELIRSSRGLAA